MNDAQSRLLARGCVLLVTALGGIGLSGCTSAQLAAEKPTRSKEYFAESEYGVKASPRVSELRTRLPRGGGRDQIGKPYKVKGKWYHPKEQPDYRKDGLASWYGDAFHGRLTANGEVYDMTHLTAAHPTMPLPSYARVTNTRNGNSLVVRVNDRGPYAHGRIIDLSRRAAELLDYTQAGVAKVEVEYLGRAPLHGQDDAFLMASYKPGGAAPDPSDGLPTGVMIAMNGATPTTASAAAPVFPGQPAAATFGAGDPILPDLGPIAPERPGIGLAARQPAHVAVLAYAEEPVHDATLALDSLAAGESRQSGPYIAVGTFTAEADARTIARILEASGSVSLDMEAGAYTVTLRPDGRQPLDDMLRAAWANGATDAMTVRE